jgi:peroxiredoxin
MYNKSILAMALVCISFVATSFSQQSLKIGQTAPAFSGTTIKGEAVELEKISGRVNALVDEYKANKDVVFLAPAASKKAELQKFLSKNPFKYQVLPDATITILTKFGVPDKDGNLNVPFPMHIVLDREGKMVLKEQGIKGIAKVKAELKNQLAQRSVAVL